MSKTIFAILMLVASATHLRAQQDNPLVGVWQRVAVNNQPLLVVTHMGKVFLPDGRLLGYYLSPTDFCAWDNNEFNPWMIGTYQVTGDKEYSETITLHQDSTYEGQLNFNYQMVHERVLQTTYQKFMDDGLPHTITELWMKKTTDPQEMRQILQTVAEHYDNYARDAKRQFGR